MVSYRMAKRPRAHTEDSETVDSDVRPGKKARNKQLRVIYAQENDESETVSDAVSESGAGDDASDHEQEYEEDDPRFMLATQVIHKELSDTGSRNVPAESGIIEEIKCTNFMCHEQLTVTLGPLINFIIGHNGSGKSAVLTALTLCLGGKATATGRAQNLKGFIKEGRHACTLSVRIKNQGSGAFKPDQYGRSIIVERQFTDSGTSGFKLKDQNGRIVSTKKADLEDILDAFALQMDNPMNVLTQDAARQFLNDSSPKAKYKFFLKGTQLESLNTDYIVISGNLEAMRHKMEIAKQDIEVLRKQAHVAITKARRAQNLASMRERETQLAEQMAWAQVRQQEDELSKIDDELSRLDRLIEERNVTADEASEQYEQANEAFSAANQQAEDYQAEKIPQEEQETEIKAKWNEVKDRLQKILTTQRKLQGQISSKYKSIESYENQIAEHRQKQAEADNGQHAQKLEELERAQEASTFAKQQLESHVSDLSTLKDDLQSAKQEKLRADMELKEKRDDVLHAQAKISDIVKGERNWMESYHNPTNLQKLLRAIENEGRFRETPIGPMGRYIKLLKPEWSSILEKQAGASLSAFVVTSKGDQEILSGIMRKLNCQHQHPIYIGSNQTINTTANEPDLELQTWMRILKIEKDIVRNQMIINHSIDQVVLIEDRQTGHRFMDEGGERRKNVKMCFTMADRDPTLGHFISWSPQSKSVTIGPIGRYQFGSRMQADKEPQLRAEKSNLERLKQELQGMQPKANDIQARVNSCEQAINGHGKRKRQLQVQWQQAQERVEELENELSAAAPDVGMIESLEQELETAKTERDFHESQFQDTVNEKDKANAESRALKDQLEEIQDRMSKLNVLLGRATKKAETIAQRRREALLKKNDALDEVKKAQDSKAQWEQDRGEQLETVEGITAEALQICPRVDVPRNETYTSLEQRKQRLVEERQASERELGGSEQQLLDLANAAKREHKNAYDGLLEMQQVSQTLKISLDNRKQRWERFKSDISTRAIITFNYLLGERKFRGKLRIDHRNEAIDLYIQPDSTVANGAGRQTKTLSGGEKSFSTICMLLALWDAMGAPIRCLDEFDVFMDNVNRDQSMKMMIQAARRSVGRQFILITPQAMNNVTSDDDVKIIRMRDPERGQTALNFDRQ